MEKERKPLKEIQTYLVYEPGYLQEQCLQKLNVIVDEFRYAMEADKLLYIVLKDIDAINVMHQRSRDDGTC